MRLIGSVTSHAAGTEGFVWAKSRCVVKNAVTFSTVIRALPVGPRDFYRH